MKRLIKSLFVLIGVILSVPVIAHPGHGTFTGHELSHYLTSPVHIGIVLGTVVILFAGYRLYKRSRVTDKK